MPQGAIQVSAAVKPNAALTARAGAPLNMDAIGALLVGKGLQCRPNITAGALLIRAGIGRVCKVFVNTAGSAPGSVNDAATTGGAAAANLLAVIPNTVGIYDLDVPVGNGIVITAGTGQVLAVSYQ